ncbi:MAG: nodulation protein NfeD [Ardenticatenaceae bacterium]|nr:nodulation protein NfeD [Ardenticatenaceae bacterium]MCB9443990.1 nodulation protein NfeD [Ardenticatenaceae bacterium]
MRKVTVLILGVFVFWLGVWSAQAQGSEVLVLEIEGAVTPAMASYFERGIAEAEARDAEALLIVLNTPGGAVDTTQEIVRAFRASTVPIIVYVSPRGGQAASAGSIITIAAHAAAMAPETVIGAASPVGDGGADLDETIFRKITEDLTALVRSLTERRGPEVTKLAEAMIVDARAVHAQEALDVGLIDAIANDVPDLLAQLDGLTVVVNDRQVVLHTADTAVQPFDMNIIEQLLHALSNPLLLGILLTIGVQAILIEMSSPGGWVAGFIGVLCLGLALYGLGQLPANWFGLGLVAVAFVLFILEVKAPVHGALALAGTLTLLGGLLVLFNSPGTPEFARISIPGAVTVSLFTAGFFIFIVTMALRAQGAQPLTGGEGLIGQKGPVRKALTVDKEDGVYRGMVLVAGELWRAQAGEAFEEGDVVRVTAVDGFTLHVKRA